MSDTMVRIDIYNSVGGAAFFEGLLHEWEREGWAVRRFHALQEDDYRTRRGRFGRLALRWRMYAGFAWTCWRQARTSRAGRPLRVVTTNPFFAPALVRWVAGNHGATIHLLYDLYPDALIRAGVVRRDSWIARRCAALTRRALRDCEATVFLGERLRRHVEATYGPARRGIVIPVGADGAPFRNHPPEMVPTPGAVRILYAGQMGRMHDVGTLREMIAKGVPQGLEFAFHASGAGYASLRGACGAVQRYRWGGALSGADWTRTMRESHVALVTMAAGAEDVVMPSKAYSALVAGQAVLAICPADSDLAALVRKHACGWVVEPGDVDALRQCCHEIASDRAGLLTKRRRAFAAGHGDYDCAVLARRWLDLFGELTVPSFPSGDESVGQRRI
jgi:glycosyltransferase involved in cell wall biosynthesis